MNDKDKPFRHVLIIGYGDIGQRVAKIWKNLEKLVFSVARSDKPLKSSTPNSKHIIADLDDPDTFNTLDAEVSKQSLLYYFAPPPASGVEDTRMAHFLAHLNTNSLPSHFIYISTSGVYGNQKGQLINEQTFPNPQVDRAKRRYDAEQKLLKWAKENTVKLTIFRVGGIYGPDRLPLKRLKDQIPMLHENLAPQTNRIHADDLAQICVAAATDKAAGEIYNISDGDNSNMTEYFNTIADFCRLPRPPLVDWQEAEKTISKGMMSYLKESRRMDNSKMLKDLKIKLIYPNLKEGLKSCF